MKKIYHVIVVAALLFISFCARSQSVNTPAGQPPFAANDTVNRMPGKPVAIAVVRNDASPEAPLNLASLSIISPATHGSLSINTSTGVITYKPTSRYFIGYDVFSYTIEDGKGATSNVATVHIVMPDAAAVTAHNRPQ